MLAMSVNVFNGWIGSDGAGDHGQLDAPVGLPVGDATSPW